MKKTILFLVLLIGVFAKYSAAQFRSAPTTISTPRGNVTVNTMVYAPDRFNYYAPASRKHKFKVVLKNDSSFICKTTIDISDSIPFIKIKEDGMKLKIRPADTKEFIRIDDGIEWRAVITDTSWLFQIAIGKISTYSLLAEEDAQLIVAIQKRTGSPIVALTRENLELMVSDRPELLKFIQKGKLLKAIKRYNE
jgi:hypothetical protein